MIAERARDQILEMLCQSPLISASANDAITWSPDAVDRYNALVLTARRVRDELLLQAERKQEVERQDALRSRIVTLSTAEYRSTGEYQSI